MSRLPIRHEFVECPTCAAQPGAPTLCRECLERRTLYDFARAHGARFCPRCDAVASNPECPEHGR